jgi:membrane protease YdiL (CAAX protease family)
MKNASASVSASKPHRTKKLRKLGNMLLNKLRSWISMWMHTYKLLAFVLVFYGLFYGLPKTSSPSIHNFDSAHFLIMLIFYTSIPLLLTLFLLPSTIQQTWFVSSTMIWQSFKLLGLLLSVMIIITWLFSSDEILVFTNPYLLPLIALFTLTTGYSEELFFRVLPLYLSKQTKHPFVYTLFQILFALPHLYQGFGGLLFALFAGAVLAHHYATHGNLHTIAITHAVFNFTNFLFILLNSPCSEFNLSLK